MKRIIFILSFFIFSINFSAVGDDLTPATPAMPAATKPADLKDLQKLIALLRQHYADRDTLTEATLSEAAIEGLLRKLTPTVQLVSPDSPANANPPTAIAKQRSFNPSVAYLRIGSLSSGAAKQIEDAVAKSMETKTEGVILDLRFAEGQDYREAATVAGLFVAKDLPLLTVQSIGADPQKIYNTRDPVMPTTPLILLINSSTRGAPEALAATLQSHKRALVVGRDSAGEAFVQSEMPINGRVLRLASGKVTVASGVDLWRRPVEPQIAVRTDPAEERGIVFETALKREKKQARVTGFIRSEAELIAQHNPDPKKTNGQGKESFLQTAAKPSVDPEEQTDDPVLQRALDVLSAWKTFKPMSPNPEP